MMQLGLRPDFVEQREAVEHRHLDVDEHDVETAALQDLKGDFSVRGGLDAGGRGRHVYGRELPHNRIVVDDQNGDRLVQHVGPVCSCRDRIHRYLTALVYSYRGSFKGSLQFTENYRKRL